MPIQSKFPDLGLTIFSRMSALAAETGAINLSQGFPDFACDASLLEGVTAAMREGHNQYAPMPGLPALRQAIAAKMAAAGGLEVDADHEITVCAGATQALYTAIATVLRSGDEAIILEPAYDSYAPAIVAQGAVPVRISLAAPDFAVDWAAVAAAVSGRTRLIIVNNPNNPATSVFSQADLAALAEIAERHDLLVLSDEVYEHLVFDGRRHASVLSHPQLRTRSFAVYSFGKTFHATGWKVGYCVAAPALTAEFRKLHQYLVFSVSTPMQHALAAHLRQAGHWQGLAAFYQAKRDRLAMGLRAAGFELLPSAATYFQLADYSRIRPDLGELAFAEWLTREHGVASIPVSAFYADGRNNKLVRFCFAKKAETLDAAIERLGRLT
ncbi:aminotransferase class I/II-fold pyridoxal phosphate-dependent enzyme [Chitinimonas arctica]|uniref:Putative 8-amino-7-oxononanoate synthase n=1 Tax=Chitinimonas arctica TaxID=2594795 RepID=A0A516SFI5_9NEIS|nr:methionine aminotransferase [Chitinimonas arctica]QDQ26926.1 aminotransferase class I/II-fold pyridoxal phosphate-dependent enzyme [Chitinimonas arctica]